MVVQWKWNRQNVVVLDDAAAGVAAGARGEDPAGALLHRARRAEPTGGGHAPGRQLPLSGALLQGRALPHGARAGNRSAGVISFWRFSCCRCSCVSGNLVQGLEATMLYSSCNRLIDVRILAVNRCVSCPFCVPLCSIRLFLFNLVSTAKE